MGYTLRIGEARSKTEYDELYLSWACDSVDGATFGAPVDPRGIDPAEHLNETWPSYTQWADFAASVGLSEVFYGDQEHPRNWITPSGVWYDALLVRHPGAVRLTHDHLVAFEAALNAYTDDQPSLRGEYVGGVVRYAQHPNDPWHRVRLEWLVWWTRWALQNCEHPALVNR